MTHGGIMETGGEQERKSALRRAIPAFAIVLVTVALASAWLVFPYLLEGRTILKDVGGTIQTERNQQRTTLARQLTREATGPGQAEIEVLFATSTYFENAGTARSTASYDPANHLVFIINETTHTVELPQELPDARLFVDGDVYLPADIEGPQETDHHRSTIVRFAKRDPAGRPIIPEGKPVVATLEMTSGWDDARTARTAVWELPIEYADIDSTLQSPMIIFALSAGLLSAVLTPCLLQLIVVYVVTLAGLGAEQMTREGRVDGATQRQVFTIALVFVIGFTVFYTLAGAAIGYAGKTAQLVFSAYSREVSVLSGILVILMGVLMGIKGRAPVVCRLPTSKLVAGMDQGGYFRSAALSVGFSLGCMTCFSGAIMATLLIYVGALGSASTGALILFIFSLGVAIPFLAAALFLSRAISVTTWISRYTPQLSFVSMVVIIAFGLVLVTDNFHVVSDAIYPWLGLD